VQAARPLPPEVADIGARAGGMIDARDLRRMPMDIVSLVLVAAFFALSWGFLALCDRL
jgi:hypothetical protein